MALDDALNKIKNAIDLPDRQRQLSNKITDGAPENVREFLERANQPHINGGKMFAGEAAKALPDPKDREDLLHRLGYLVEIEKKTPGAIHALNLGFSMGLNDPLRYLMDAKKALEEEFGEEKAAA